VLGIGSGTIHVLGLRGTHHPAPCLGVMEPGRGSAAASRNGDAGRSARGRGDRDTPHAARASPRPPSASPLCPGEDVQRIDRSRGVCRGFMINSFP